MAKTNRDGPQARQRDLSLKQEDDWCTNVKLKLAIPVKMRLKLNNFSKISISGRS
jgi:hypothetical protein